MKTNLKEMWREHRMLLVLTSAIILLQMLVGVLLWDRLPDPIATHFNFHNEPDGWSSKRLPCLACRCCCWGCITCAC